MLKKTISYTDIDGIPRTEDFYFNLTKAEILELQVSRSGGFAEAMDTLVKSKDAQLILATIKEIILKAYGERSAESRHFIKRPEHAEAFSHTEAFSNLFMELFGDANKAAEFVQGLMPQDLMEQVRAEQSGRPATQDYQQKQTATILQPIVQDETPVATQADFMLMSLEDAQDFVRRGGKIQGL